MKDDELIELLKKYMLDKGFSYADIAKELDVSTGNVSNWLNRKYGITSKNRAKILAVMGSYYTDNTMQLKLNTAINHSAASVNGNAIVNNDNANIDEILSQIMDSDMCPECKIKAYNIIKKKP